MQKCFWLIPWETLEADVDLQYPHELRLLPWSITTDSPIPPLSFALSFTPPRPLRLLLAPSPIPPR